MQRLAAEKRTCTPRTVVRRLQELAEEEVIKVQIVNGNAQYQYIEIPNADGWYKERCMRYMVIRKDTWVPLSKIQEDAAKKGGDPFRVAAAMDELVKEGHLIRRAPDIAWGRTEVSYQYDPWVC